MGELRNMPMKGINDRLYEMSDKEISEILISVENDYNVIYGYINAIDFSSHIESIDSIMLDIIKIQKHDNDGDNEFVTNASDELQNMLRIIVTPKIYISEFIKEQSEILLRFIKYKEDIIKEGKSRGMSYNGGILTGI